MRFLVVLVAAAAAAVVVVAAAIASGAAPIPLIINTDLGDDMDDQFALSLALADPAFDVKLVLTASHNTVAKAQSVARMLYDSGRLDVPVGIGYWMDNNTGPNPTYEVYGRFFSLDDFVAKGGTLYRNGLAKAADIIDAQYAAGAPVAWLGIAPLTNEGPLVSTYPQQVAKVKVMSAMVGALWRCYGNVTTTPGQCREYNAVDRPVATQEAFNAHSATWPVIVSPLDVCGTVHVEGDEWTRLYHAYQQMKTNKILRTLLDLYCLVKKHEGKPTACTHHSSTLYDATSLYFLKTLATVETKQLRIWVENNGTFTVARPDGKLSTVALSWKGGSDAAWQKDVVDTLINAPH